MTNNISFQNKNYSSSDMTLSILMTGHRGYIGSAIIEFLLSIKTIDNIIGYDIADGDDILDYDNLINIMKSNNINLVIHLAALSSVTACNEDPKKTIKVNPIGTYNILNAMKQADCCNIIYASTSSIYGNNELIYLHNPYTEDMHLNPCSAYGVSKLLS
jgi:nucleoside-diphosphate-sugar epimerase